MKSFAHTLRNMIMNPGLRQKILITLGLLAVYRFLVYIPVPFVDIDLLAQQTIQAGEGLGYFVMLLGGTLDQFSILAVGLAPYINASIIMQLMGSVIPQLEELQEQGEAGTVKMQQYTRMITFPLAFLQGIGMVYFINYLLASGGGGNVIDVSNFGIVLLSAFVLAVGSMLVMRIGELITEKGISNGISLIIFASIVAGITQGIFSNLSAATNFFGLLIFMLVIILVLVLLSIFILKSVKEIPIIYSKQGKVNQTSTLPIPLNPVGMVPIIFSIAFASFPYIISQVLLKLGVQSERIINMASRIETNLNIYSQSPSPLAIAVFFVLIVVFTFFYSIVVFNPERMADTIQKRGGFVQGIRPGRETADYINGIIMHLCLRGGLGLALIGVYSYLLNYIPFIQTIVRELGSLPVVVTGSGVIIIVGVVQDVFNKVKSDLMMSKYDS